MKHPRHILLVLLASLLPVAAGAQNLSDLRIGEVLCENTSGLTDGFGQRNGWIELFNNSNGTVKFGGCYLTDDASNLKKYHIPTSDRSTQVGPRQSVVFFASGNSSQGTYYTNFTIERGETIYLVSNDGRTIIDSITVPADLPADKSVVKYPVGIKEMDFDVRINDNPSPGAYNGDVDAKTKSEVMKEKDPHGWVLSLIAVTVVFSALLILAFIFGWIGKWNNKDKAGAAPKVKARKMKADVPDEVAAAISMALQQEFSDEVYAAIALALDDYLGTGIHDEESFVITIVPSQNGNWSDKTQTFRQLPR